LLGGGLSWPLSQAREWVEQSVVSGGALIGMGIPEYVAKRYEGRVKDGGILLSVHSDDSQWTRKAKEILERTGAQDVSSSGEASSEKGDKDPVRQVA
jgi:hypothetical protein